MTSYYMKELIKALIYVGFIIIGIVLALLPEEDLRLLINVAVRFSIAVGVATFGAWVVFHEKK